MSDKILVFKRPFTQQATSLRLTIEGETNMGLTVDTTTGEAVLQFEDKEGNPVEGPWDSVDTTAYVAPGLSSDNPAVLTVGTAVADPATPGRWTAPLTPVAVGSANLSVAPLANSDGSPVLEMDGPNTGQPFAVPAPVAQAVEAGEAESLVLSTTS
jgi:hypothetical protein